MTRFSYDLAPDWVTSEKCVMTDSGWVGVDTGEIYVAIPRGLSKSGAGDVLGGQFSASSLGTSVPFSVSVDFNEYVDVTAGASIVVTATAGGNITLYAAAGQTGVSRVVFAKQVNQTTNQNTSGVAATLSIGAQTIGGTIVDSASSVKATGVLTLSANPLNNETVTIDGKVYTFKTTLTNTDGFVKVGSSTEDSLANLIAAINLSGKAGTNYATATTLHSTVSASDVDSNPLNALITAKTAGTAGNSLATTETLTNGSFGGATLSGGVAPVATTKTISAPIATAMGTCVVA